jgi:two-component system phosphate regulon sensor histidine kinase PhoR
MNQMASQLDDRMKTVVRQRNELEAVLSCMVEGVIAVDMDERLIRMNRAAGQMLNCDPSQSKGRSIQELSRNPGLHEFIRSALSSKELVEKEIVIYSEEERIIRSHGTVLKSEAGSRIGALIVMNDVTHLKKLERIRQDFVANVSHEIKTPLTAIQGFAETLQQGGSKKPEETERFLNIIMKHVDRLNLIIEDLLQLSRIEQDAEKEKIVLEEGQIKDLLQTTMKICREKADEKKIIIELSCDDGISAKIHPSLLERAFVNILDNAIKFSPREGTIQVNAVQTDEETAFSFRDNGIGVPSEHLPRLFERFYRVDKGRSRKQGGSGLGLAIAKHIIQAHGGNISAESVLGKGSIFTIRLPKK